MFFANNRRANTLLSCFVFIVANLLPGLEPVVALAHEPSLAQQAQETTRKLANERSAAWWPIAGQSEAQYSDSASFVRKPHRAHDRQRRSEAQCTSANEGCLERKTGMVTAKSNADEIPTDIIFDVPLSSEERVAIWRALGERAISTSIPVGLHVGETVPSTTCLLSFSDDLRKNVPAILRFSYALLHGQVLIVGRRR
jgi:hypothetical protein